MEIGKAWTGISAVRCKASGSPEKRVPSDVKGRFYKKLALTSTISASKKEVSPMSLGTPLIAVKVESAHLLFRDNPVCPLRTQWYRMGWFDRQDDRTECRFPVDS